MKIFNAMVIKEDVIEKVKNISKKEMSKNKRFHDYAHVLSVFNNVNKIIREEGIEKKVDSLIILTGALLHDLSDIDGGIKEGLNGAKKARKILKKIKGFPEDKIKDVERLIVAIDRDKGDEFELDEMVLCDADRLDALSELGICRSFMLLAKRGLNLQEAVLDYWNYIERKDKKTRYYTKTARGIAKKNIVFVKKFSDDCLGAYDLD